MKLKYLLFAIFFPFYSCVSSTPIKEAPVLPGVYQVAEYVPLLNGKTIALVVNQASQINGIHLVDTLLKLNTVNNTDITIKSLFSPEHGFSGVYDAGMLINEEDKLNDSINIRSLYGSNKKPTKTDLEGIDYVVFDLQDVGVRFYTYISTLYYVMQACAENDISLIVLDRPNPHINYIDGPILEESQTSFVGMHQVPVVYGMTIGEYAKLINGEGWLGNGLECNLKIVEIANYSRNSVYTIPIKPSPNLPNMQSILLYPSLCFFEGTVMSIGRGTDKPFQVFGHPNYPDKSFSFKPVSTPGASLYPKHEDEICYGINLSIIPIDSLRQVSELNISWLIDAYKKMQMGADFFTDYFKLLAGTEEFQQQIIKGLSEKEIRASWKPGLEKFEKIRLKYLVYK